MRPPLPPEHALQTALASTSYRGTFESHITIEAMDPSRQAEFREVCRQLGVKSVLIELPEGVARSQPMTACYHHGEISSVVEEISRQCRALRAVGFGLARVKLEAVASNDGVPDTDEEAARAPAANYFEFHVKLLLPATADLDALRACCGRHKARLSRNALKTESDGRSERFVTLRQYGMGRRRAFACLEALERDLTAVGFPIAQRQKEYTLFDSAERLDAGWLDPPAESGS